MPRFVFVDKDKKNPNRDELPSRVSVGGAEYDVDEEGSVEAPMSERAALQAHGFELRGSRPRVEVKAKEPPKEPPKEPEDKKKR